MRIFGHSHALRAIAWRGHGRFGRQQTSQPHAGFNGIIGTYRQSTEPFGLFPLHGPLGPCGKNGWVRAQARRRKGATGALRRTASAVASPAALQFFAIVDNAKAVRAAPAWARSIARSISDQPMSDLAQYGAIDVWSSPLDVHTCR